MGAVYLVASYEITDPERYEGAAAGHTVVFRFPSEPAFQAWRHGDEVAAALQIRDATTANRTVVLADGVGP